MNSLQILTAACPTCGAAGQVMIESESSSGQREFRFTCPDGHQLTGDAARQLWIGAHN